MKLHLQLLGVVVALAAGAAEADREVFDVSDPTYRAECGSCHIPYPPQLLSKASWQGIMARLNKHFGSDASIDAKTAQQIEAYLTAHAARGTKGSAASMPSLRMTDTPWFIREHDEVPQALWKSPTVRSPANCGACHVKAEEGDFSERNLRLPR